MTSIGMTSHCMTSRYGVHFCIECVNMTVQCTIDMSSFNTVRVMVHEIFNNSHYFQDDPRITEEHIVLQYSNQISWIKFHQRVHVRT